MSVFDNLYEGSANKVSDTNSSSEKLKRRTPRESEEDLTAAYVFDGYRTQISTKKDDNGEIIEVAYGTKGSRRPDAINMDDDHVKIVEVKNYGVVATSGKNNLVSNIRKQTDKSIAEYGDDVEITEVIDVRGQDVTIEDMDKLTKKIEERVPEVGLDYRW